MVKCSKTIFVTFFVFCFGCTTSEPNGVDAGDVGANRGGEDMLNSVPSVTRPASVSCSMDRQAVPVTAEITSDRDECDVDADCSESESGRCRLYQEGDGDLIKTCTYHDCANDADCGVGFVCECGDPKLAHAQNSERAWDNNRCVEAECTRDTDCGAEYCVPRYVGCDAFRVINGWFCTSENDECTIDMDCDTPFPVICNGRRGGTQCLEHDQVCNAN